VLLTLKDVHASYGGLLALRGVDLAVDAGEIVAVVGGNGAGKSTLLKVASGMHAPDRGEVMFDGTALHTLPAYKVARLGVALVPEGRRLFPRLKVRDNLRLGTFTRRDASDRDAPLKFVFSLFPRLATRLDQRAETLSGGEQQMLAIGRALMGRPRLLMLDEPSQGIMPRLVDELFEAVSRIRAEGTAVLIVEQRVAESLELADRAYVVQSGRVAISGPSRDIARDPAVRKAYLGV
jgi:branched-chain amino acid transport system ATP-binding protein